MGALVYLSAIFYSKEGEKKAMKIKLAQDDGDKDVMKLKREEIGKERRVGVGDGNRERNTTTQ